MLIEGVLKHIEKEHADYNNLVAARESVVSVIFTIEEEGRFLLLSFVLLTSRFPFFFLPIIFLEQRKIEKE